jgi:predicted small lipoprotein YifL
MRMKSQDCLFDQTYYKLFCNVAFKLFIATLVCLSVASCGNKSALFLDKPVSKDVVQKEASETEASETPSDPVELKQDKSKGEAGQ